MPATDPKGVDRSEPSECEHKRREPTQRPDDLVSPVKAVRLLKALGASFDEMNRVDLDDAARRRLIATHRAALIEVASTVSDALIDELVTLGVEPLSQDASLDQLKVAQAQLLGWVNGVVLAKATLGTPTQVEADDASVPLDRPAASHAAR
jgi:Protein of unknown function (DUF2587)